MTQPSGPLYTVAQLRELDRLAIEALGGDGHALMARAGAAAFRRLRARWPEVRVIAVACGSGNNGGDGYVVAQLANVAGLSARVLRVDEREPSSADARCAREGFHAHGGKELVFDATTGLPECELIVDGLFGIGLTRAPEPPAAALIEAINASRLPVLALDVPSGLDSDTGHCPGACVRATLTVSFIGAKRGLATGRAADHVGELVLEGLEVPSKLRGAIVSAARTCDDATLRELLPRRRRAAHKGDFGHVLVVGGDHGYGGAARLAAEGAARCGAGLVSVATRAEHVAALLSARPELMVHAVAGATDLAGLVDRADVVCLGPGLGQGAWSRALYDRALASARSLVLDADGLNLLAAAPAGLPPASVITPHPGEAARLLGLRTAAVQADRYGAAAALARRYGCVAVLKGAGTIVATADGSSFDVSPAANPGMGSGGMGDVLAGVIAALLAQGLEPRDAARAGVALHARAAADAARGGERGMLAGDVLAALRIAANP